MNRLGMLVDLSHVSPETMNDALDVVAGAGHLLALVGARRGRPSAQRARRSAARLPQNGGVVMVTFVPQFVSNAERRSATTRRPMRCGRRAAPGSHARTHPRQATCIATHRAREAASRASTTSASAATSTASRRWSVGLEDVSTYPALFAELVAPRLDRGGAAEAGGRERAARVARRRRRPRRGSRRSARRPRRRSSSWTLGGSRSSVVELRAPFDYRLPATEARNTGGGGRRRASPCRPRPPGAGRSTGARTATTGRAARSSRWPCRLRGWPRRRPGSTR